MAKQATPSEEEKRLRTSENKKRYNEKFHSVNVRFDKDDYKKLEDEARKFGFVKSNGQPNVTKYVRIKSLKDDKGIVKQTSFYKEINFQIRKIGTNLNQFVRRLNALTGNISDKEIKSELDTIKTELKDIMNKL